MTRDQQRLADYLAHILEAIERIERYTEDVVELAFLDNQMVQDAVIRNFEIIGEASHNIEIHYPAFVSAHPALPLANAYQMRNAVAHGYFNVDIEIVWKTIHSDLPGLYQQVTSALSDLLPMNEDFEVENSI
jgi:uncharacterized protein with HEPN domain